jgi:hypothetical protein
MRGELENAVQQELTIKSEVVLRRCPFCTGTEQRAVRGILESGDLGAFTIECTSCLCAGPPAETLEKAAKRWNLRLL